MKRGIILIVALFLMMFGVVWVANPAYAQNAVIVPLAKSQLTWNWAKGTEVGVNDGDVSEFRMKCGASTGVYTKTTVIADSAARSTPISAVVDGPGEYFCVVTAANAVGESGPSNEVNFIAGSLPSAATGLTIESQ